VFVNVAGFGVDVHHNALGLDCLGKNSWREEASHVESASLCMVESQAFVVFGVAEEADA
jgi:hypothetical protein